MKTVNQPKVRTYAATVGAATITSQSVPKLAKTGHTGRFSRFRLMMVITGKAVVIRSIGGEWYTKCRDAYAKQQAKKQKSSTPVVRAAPKCGFCGSHQHNRRNCTKMAAFIAQCKKANYNYRQLFHDTFVKQYGIDVGAAISVRKEHWSDEVVTFIGLITKINLDKINVFTAFDYGWDVNEKYGQPIEVQALVDGNETWINISTFCRDNAALKPLVKRQSSHYSRLVLTKVIGKSETPLPDDWVTSYDDAWEFLAKKRSYEKLKEDGVVAHIEKWANMR